MALRLNELSYYAVFMNICILGAGAWGTSMAQHLVRSGQNVTLVPRRIEHATAMATTHENADYLPGIALDPNIQIAFELRPALMEAELVLFACPSQGLRDWCERLKPVLDSALRLRALVTLCKGLEQSTLRYPVDLVREIIPGYHYGVLSGPNYAREVAEGKPTATVLAMDAPEDELAAYQEALHGERLRVYRSSDVAGVELGGCLKNIYAIGAGFCDGLSLGDNARAAFLTRALHEMVRLGVAFGGRKETFYGLSGIGDLTATCSGEWSRNRTFGESIARGRSVAGLMDKRKTVVEGYWATACFYVKCKEKELDAPILGEVYKVLHEGKQPAQVVEALMSRPTKPEYL